MQILPPYLQQFSKFEYWEDRCHSFKNSISRKHLAKAPCHVWWQKPSQLSQCVLSPKVGLEVTLPGPRAGSWRNKLKNLVILLWKSLCQGCHDTLSKPMVNPESTFQRELLVLLTALLNPLIEILFLMCLLCSPYILFLQSSLLGPPVFLISKNQSASGLNLCTFPLFYLCLVSEVTSISLKDLNTIYDGFEKKTCHEFFNTSQWRLGLHLESRPILVNYCNKIECKQSDHLASQAGHAASPWHWNIIWTLHCH